MFQEALFVTSANGGDKQHIMCSAWDIRTGTNLMKYKSNNENGTRSHSLNIVKDQYVMIANANKPLIHIWPINSQEQLRQQRYVLPGVATALAMAPDSCFLVAGIQETIYIWNINTGRLCNAVNKHFQCINCLRFTDNGSHFASGGNDGMVMVWNLTQLVTMDDEGKIGEPLYSFNDHGLPVTDIHIGTGGLRAYMYTISIDRSCKVYDLSTGGLLLNIVFRASLHSITVDSLENKVFVGTNNGNIFDFNIGRAPRTKEYHLEDKKSHYSGHNSNCVVNCLALSYDSQTLISAGSDGQIMIWNISSHQLYKTLEYSGAISNIFVQLINPFTFHVDNKPLDNSFFSSKLKRVIEPVESYESEIIDIMVDTNLFEEEDSKRAKMLDEIMECYGKAPASLNCVPPDNSDVIENLRTEIALLKLANKKLFAGAAEVLIKEDSIQNKRKKLKEIGKKASVQ